MSKCIKIKIKIDFQLCYFFIINQSKLTIPINHNNIKMDNNTLSNLTTNLETFVNLDTTPENATNILFPDIQKLLDLSPEMRKQLLSKWKYYNEFLLTIEEHSNTQQANRLVTWEQSFTMTLLLFIFH